MFRNNKPRTSKHKQAKSGPRPPKHGSRLNEASDYSGENQLSKGNKPLRLPPIGDIVAFGVFRTLAFAYWAAEGLLTHILGTYVAPTLRSMLGDGRGAFATAPIQQADIDGMPFASKAAFNQKLEEKLCADEIKINQAWNQMVQITKVHGSDILKPFTATRNTPGAWLAIIASLKDQMCETRKQEWRWNGLDHLDHFISLLDSRALTLLVSKPRSMSWSRSMAASIRQSKRQRRRS